ncbi:hypothetical protein ACFQLX_20485 [Streptomyces polyrhachis]|uniref:Uncharacterized protein n=1 Tax=Streptomyces polyrhachis TaxID=1282885 RepID=A0ABW2GLL6_9ACTN
MHTLIISADQQSSLTAMTPAAIVAGCALVFTVVTFWLLNAYQGNLKSWEPQSFSAAITSSLARLRLPLVLYNTGAKPIVILDLRVTFPDGGQSVGTLQWQAACTQLRPKQGEDRNMKSSFAISGRAAEQVFIEFGADFPAFIPEVRDYVARVEVKVGHKEGWQTLIDFTLRIPHIRYPDSYITYDNSSREVAQEERDSLEAAFGKLRSGV